MEYAIYPCSEKMQKHVSAYSKQTSRPNVYYKPHGNTKYPWGVLEVGQSFAIPFYKMRKDTLKTYISVMGKKMNMKFIIVTHEEHGVFEIGRVL